MNRDALLERYAWWASLNHGGMLIAPSKLAGRFDETIAPLAEGHASRLRRDVLRARDGDAESVSTFLDTVLEDVAGLHRVRWIKGSEVSKEHTRASNAGEALRPARLWLGDNGARLAVFYPDAQSGGLRVPKGYRIGVGRGRRAVVRVLEWLRKGNEKIALLVTGRQLRLIHAGSDYEAFCEWDTDLWFREGAPGPQVDALRLLLATEPLTPPKLGTAPPLLAAIAESRKGQAELSAALGERVRQAVELLIQASGPRLAPLVEAADTSHVDERDVYLAATRLIMRCVVVLFAEARELLPRTNPVYEQSYGLQALRVELERQSGGRSAERLRTRYGAWPRLLALFALMFEGSAHEALPLTRYGGGLFEPGDEASDDPVRRAIAALEQADVRDADIQRILELLTRCPTRVRQGRGSTTVQTPVDFSDLSSEYLGILYEGLLDYELKRAGATDAVIFLGVGAEPALPFDLLNRMSSDELAELLKKLGKATKATDDEEEDEADEEDDGDKPEGTYDAAPADDAIVDDSDDRGTIREHVQDWAERAVKAAKLVKYPKKDTDPRVREAFAREVTARGKSLVRRLVLPGDWYLVRWGGTRKGAGTFYTRPQLTGPMVRRALAPLCFDDAVDGADPQPKKPEEILANRVCDPAMGSGSFLVSALRYLTDALLQSLYVHGRLAQHGERWYIRLADGLPLDDPEQESLPAPKDDDNLDDILRARLKRHVVERCIYGVDLDPLAVELARTALWVETMDYQLPFGFLDHKLKCGNALVGAWLDRFEDYPIRAWDRDGGDTKHTNFVHHFRVEKGKKKPDVWTAALKAHREKVILPLLRSELEKLKAEAAGQVVAEFVADGKKAAALHAEALAAFDELHRIIPIYEAAHRAKVYKEKVLDNPSLRALRAALDTWCAIWFWPGDKLELAPTPANLLAPPAETQVEVTRLAREMRFFHWEIEFPEVMTSPTSGFSAVVGNPPWDKPKPNSMEFFSNDDPLYRTYGKQQALRKQTDFFRDRVGIEDRWMRYSARFKALSNWSAYAAFPFGADGDGGDALGGINSLLLTTWQERRNGRPSFADRAHPLRYQGSADLNTYKMFLEIGHALLRTGGTLGILVPSGIYSDAGTAALRRLFLERCQWTHLYSFQNARYVFAWPVRDRQKMAYLTIVKGGRTAAVLARFRLGPGDSPEASELESDITDDTRYMTMPVEDIVGMSPTLNAIFELNRARDVRLLGRLFEPRVTVGSLRNEGYRFTRELDKTNDSALLHRRPELEQSGVLQEKDDVRSLRIRRSLLEHGWVPVWEGRCCRFEFWIQQPSAFAKVADVRQFMAGEFPFGVRRIARNTDERTLFACVAPAGVPTMYTIEVCRELPRNDAMVAYLLMSSFVLDYVARFQVSSSVTIGNIESLPWPARSTRPLAPAAHRLAQHHPTIAAHAQARAAADALVAEFYGLAGDDFRWILRDCDHPATRVCEKSFSRTLDPKGFWRVDKDKPAELRHTVLSLVAFLDLKKIGLEAFLALNDGAGWRLPETLRLADYGLGHDDRAKEHQPVAATLSEPLLAWQLSEDTEVSEEEDHAALIDKIRSVPGQVPATGPVHAKASEHVQVGLFDGLAGGLALPEMPSVIPNVSLEKEAGLIVWALLYAAGGVLTRTELARAFALRSRPELMQRFAGKLSKQAKHWAVKVASRSVRRGMLRATITELAERDGFVLRTNAQSHSIVGLGRRAPAETRIDVWFHFEARLTLQVLRALPVDAFEVLDGSLSADDRAWSEAS